MRDEAVAAHLAALSEPDLDAEYRRAILADDAAAREAIGAEWTRRAVVRRDWQRIEGDAHA